MRIPFSWCYLLSQNSSYSKICKRDFFHFLTRSKKKKIASRFRKRTVQGQPFHIANTAVGKSKTSEYEKSHLYSKVNLAVYLFPMQSIFIPKHVTLFCLSWRCRRKLLLFSNVQYGRNRPCSHKQRRKARLPALIGVLPS